MVLGRHVARWGGTCLVLLAAHALAGEGDTSDAAAPAVQQVDPALRDLVALGPRALVHLVASDTAGSISRTPEEVLAALAASDRAKVLAEVALLLAGTPSAGEQTAAVRIFGACGDGRHVAALLEVAQRAGGATPTLRFREVVEKSLASLLVRVPAGFAELRQMWTSVPGELRGAALKAVGETRRPEALEFLQGVLRLDPDACDSVLGQVARLAPYAAGDTESLAAEIRALLASQEPGRPQAAAIALGALGDEDAVPPLVDLLASADAPTRGAASWALRRITGLDLRDHALWSAWLARERAWLPESAPHAFEMLASSRPEDATRAIRDVAGHRLARDLRSRKLAGALQHADAYVRHLAAEALAQSGSRAAAPALVEALADPTPAVADAALAALRAITGLELPPQADLWHAALRR